MFLCLVNGRDIKGLDFDGKLPELDILILLVLISLKILTLLFSPQNR
jgi:hypothetical protein